MGRQNHATSPSATPPLVSHAALAHEFRSPCDHRTRHRRVHTARPAFVTIAIRPSQGDRMDREIAYILKTGSRIFVALRLGGAGHTRSSPTSRIFLVRCQLRHNAQRKVGPAGPINHRSLPISHPLNLIGRALFARLSSAAVAPDHEAVKHSLHTTLVEFYSELGTVCSDNCAVAERAVEHLITRLEIRRFGAVLSRDLTFGIIRSGRPNCAPSSFSHATMPRKPRTVTSAAMVQRNARIRQGPLPTMVGTVRSLHTVRNRVSMSERSPGERSDTGFRIQFNLSRCRGSLRGRRAPSRLAFAGVGGLPCPGRCAGD